MIKQIKEWLKKRKKVKEENRIIQLMMDGNLIELKQKKNESVVRITENFKKIQMEVGKKILEYNQLNDRIVVDFEKYYLDVLGTSIMRAFQKRNERLEEQDFFKVMSALQFIQTKDNNPLEMLMNLKKPESKDLQYIG